MTDKTALLAAMIAAPGDDLPRLVYADWLEENAGAEACGRCGGGGEEMTSDKHGYTDYPMRCRACDGTGRVSDGRPERSQFIRVQCEIAATRHNGTEGDGGCPTCEKLESLRRRERGLWDSPTGRVRSDAKAAVPDGWDVTLSNPISVVYAAGYGVVRRGFVHTLRGPFAAFWEERECERCRNRMGGRESCPDCRVSNRTFSGPTAAFRELARREPVERVEVTDREPFADPSGSWLWFSSPNDLPEGTQLTARSVSDRVFRAMTGPPVPFYCRAAHKEYPTRAAARDTLSEALIVLARGGTDAATL